MSIDSATFRTMTAATHSLLREVLEISAKPVGIAAAVGLIWSIIQGLFQMQDQTTGSVLKLVAVAAILWFFGDQLMNQVVGYADLLLHQAFPRLAELDQAVR